MVSFYYIWTKGMDTFAKMYWNDNDNPQYAIHDLKPCPLVTSEYFYPEASQLHRTATTMLLKLYE